MTDPTTDRSELREQLLDALDFSYCQGLGFATPEALLAAYDAASAVSLPPTDQTADRRSVLNEAADRAEIVALRLRLKHDYGAANGAREVGAELRRMADETPAAETQDEAWQREWDRRPEGADVSDLFEITAVVPCSGTLFSAHQPHTWEPQPGAPVVHCPGERQPADGPRQDGDPQ